MKTRALFIGSDHRGYELKKELLHHLKTPAWRTTDVGTQSLKPVDYPDYAETLGLRVAENPGSRGILICGSGVGASIAANKLPGVRAALCHDTYSAHQGVEHDDMNVLVLGSLVIGRSLAEELVRAFLSARFDEALRHVRRVKKIRELESKYFEVSFSERIA